MEKLLQTCHGVPDPDNNLPDANRVLVHYDMFIKLAKMHNIHYVYRFLDHIIIALFW